jgi:hypothetical protein
MRKLLLASAAVLGATSGIASAQTPTPAAANMMMQPSQGQMPLPWSQGPTADNNNNSYGMPSTYAGAAAYGANAVPTPGTVVIRLNGKVEFDADVWGGSTQVTQGTAAVTGSNKLNPITFGVFARLYPGVDGMATNGLRYGASIELRENFPGSVPQQTPLLSSAPSASAYSSGETIYVRRAFAYLAADNIGLLRLGQGDGVIGLFDPCIFSGQCYDAGTGNFNGGNIQAQMPAGAAVAGASFAWLAQGGAEYANTKIVYLSPQFFGFDLGVQYAPSMGNGESACGVATVGATAAAQQAASTCNAVTTGSDPTRWYNQVGVGVRYQGVFGPWSVGAYGFWEGASKDDFFGPAVGQGRGLTGTKYDNLNFFSTAAYVKFDTGVGTITGAIDYIGGAINVQLAMRPTGGVPESSYLPSLMYANGPFTAEVEAEFVNSQGSASLTSVSQRREFGFAVGGAYNVAPGLYLVLEYQYDYRHQGGFDFANNGLGAGATGVAGTAGWKAGLTRDSHAQGVLFSTVVNW